MALKNLFDMVTSGVKALQTINAKDTLKKNQGASGGAQTPDSGGMGTAKQRQQGGTNLGLGLKSTEVPSNPNATFNTYNPNLGEKSIVERARAFSEERRARSPLRRNTPSSPTPFAQRKADRERRMMYDDILDRAGAGPGKDISLRNALGIINEMEGQRLGAETARRGQDIAAETADLQRENVANIARNRQRIQETLGQGDLQERSLSRQQRQAQFEAKEARGASEFAARQQLAADELEQGLELGRMRAETAAMKEDRADERAFRKAYGDALGEFATKDEVTGEVRFPIDTPDDPEFNEATDLNEYLERLIRAYK